MSANDDLRFQMMGLGGPAAPAPAAGAAPAKGGPAKKDAGYPTFEGLLGDKARFDALMASTEKTMKRLEELADKGGTPQAKGDARKALRAYDHALELLRKGLELKTQILKEKQAQAQKAGAKK
ncbi:MAG TPA: hypothetical protein VHF22_13405 [Planctomycetota bacterium]|nr:hypothetical protein [Planctomycetota bacterium]